MIARPRSGRRRRAASLALTIAAVSGCATRTTSVRPDAPDLLNVSAVAPAINAGPDSSKLAGPDVSPSLPRSASSGDPATSLAEGTQTVQEGLPTESLGPTVGALAPTSADPEPSLPDAGSTPPSIPQAAAPFPIDLTSALRLADNQNPVIGEARTLILGALAERQAARALLLPYLNAGGNYHDHTGPLQRSSGTILRVTEQSFYFGGGARTVAAESVAIPAVNIFSPLTDAIFSPLAAQQQVVGARFNASDTANKVLLEVASLYIDLIGAEAILEVRRSIGVEADRIADSVAAFATTGQGRKADAERADADRRLFQARIQRAEERVAVASAMLAERLNLDPSSQLKPIAGPLEPLELIDPEAPTDALIKDAVARRPDLAAREANVAQAEYRVQQEKFRPLLPTIWLGFSGGAFGGSGNLVPPTNSLGAFAGRTDFDVRAYWTVLNLGAGNLSLIKQRKAQAGQAIADRSIVLNRIRAEVAEARAEARALTYQVEIARVGLRSAQEGYRLDQARLRESLALPIEALDSLRLLSDAKVVLVEAITRANRNQFALFVSLGAPPPLDHPGQL
jgi:outer membrane protein TolC